MCVLGRGTGYVHIESVTVILRKIIVETYSIVISIKIKKMEVKQCIDILITPIA